tara:strand:- start:102 stop:245 length:144 start_codon:yes stop_codon:yes gene_type:complete
LAFTFASRIKGVTKKNVMLLRERERRPLLPIALMKSKNSSFICKEIT